MKKFLVATIILLILGGVFFYYNSTFGSVVNTPLPVKNGPILWYTFDGDDVVMSTTTVSSTIKDHLDNGTFGVVSKTTLPVPGALGQAYSFNGDTNSSNQSYIELGDRPDLVVSNAFTFAVWVKWTEVSSTAKRYIFRQSGNFGPGIYQGINSTQIACSFHPSDVSLYPTVTSTPGLNDGEWHHVICTYDGNRMKMWTDGVPTVGDFSTHTVHYENYNATIGRGANETPRPYQGEMDDFRMFNVAVDTSTALSIYAEGNSKMNVNLGGIQQVAGSNPSGLVAWWSVDGLAVEMATAPNTSTLRDLSGYGNHMYTTNSPRLVPGAVGQGTEVDAGNYWLTSNFTSSSVLFPSSSPFSVSVWASFTQTAITGLMYKCSNTFGFSIRSLVTTGFVDFNFFKGDNGSVRYVATSTRAMNDGQIHHYVGTYDQQAIRLYVDGELHGYKEATSTVTFTVPQCSIGRNIEPANNFPFTGQIDEVKVWNRALTPTEVQYQYNAGK